MRKIIIMFLIFITIIGITGCSSLPFISKDYTLDINKKGQGAIVEPDANGEYEFEEDTIVSIKIDPAENYEFEKWEGENSSDLLEKDYNREWEITMDENKSITAVFDKKEYSIIEGQINVYNRMDNSVQSSSVNLSNEEKQVKNNNVSTSYKENEIIIKYKSTVSIQSAKSIEKNNSLSKMSQMKNRRDIALYKIPKDKTVPQMVDKFKKQENVEWVEPNYIYKAMEVPDDPDYDKQWGHIQMNLELAWDVEKGSNSVKVAVVDTGIIPDHPDLKGNLSDKGVDFVGGANEEPVNDYNKTDNDPTDETPYAPNDPSLNGSHGTHVAGIIGAVANNTEEGIVGVNWNVDILPVRVLGADGTGTTWDIAEGIYYAVDQGVDIINLSLGGSNGNEYYKEALEYAYNEGVIVFAASGNSGDSEIIYPAKYESTVAVGSINSNYKKSSFSNYGSKLDLVAPGGINSYGKGIYSTWGYYDSNNDNAESDYTYKSGTSMATPYASGVAALLIANGVTGVENIKERMTSTAIDLGKKGKDNDYGYGLIDAYGALLNEEIGGPYIFAGKETDGNIEIVSEVIQFSDGDYQLNNVEPGEVKVYGWRDSNNNNKIDAGDYWGESDPINAEANNSYSLDFDIDYINESNVSSLTIKEMGEF